MRFEVNLPAGIAAWALRAAGLDAQAFMTLSVNRFEKKAQPLPVTVLCRFLHSEKPLEASVTVFEFGVRENIDRSYDKQGKIVLKRQGIRTAGTRILVDIADEQIGSAIQKKLDHYSLENDGEGLWWQEHCALWEQVDEVLKPNGLSHFNLQRGEGVLTRAAIEGLMQLCDNIEPMRQSNIHWLFTERCVAKSERVLVAPWLLKRFEADPEVDDQIGMRIWENAVPEIADDLIRLIEDRRYSHHRGPLCQALAKTKHSRAAEVIASVMEEKWMAIWCLSALGKVRGAEKHLDKIQRFLHHSQGEVRREAKKLLKKLGVVVETPPPPPPVHLVKKRRTIPKGLEEWSSNLDMDDLSPTLQKVSMCVEKGFAESEIAEIMAVAEGMAVDQTKAFRFDAMAGGVACEVWVVIFMDDIDSPDLEVHSNSAVIRKLEELTENTGC